MVWHETVKVGFSHVIVQVCLNWKLHHCTQPGRKDTCQIWQTSPWQALLHLPCSVCEPAAGAEGKASGNWLFAIYLWAERSAENAGPGHVVLQRGSFLKYVSSCAVAQILVALSHSCSLCIQHPSLLLLSSGLDFSYLKSDTSRIFVLFVTTN